MMHRIASSLVCGLVAASCAAQPEPMTAQEMSEGVTEMLQGYAIDRYEGDVEGIKAVVHHDVARRMLSNTYWGQPSEQWVRPLNHDQLAFDGTSSARGLRSDPENGLAKVTIYDTARESVSAVLETDELIELIHAVSFEGEWLIVDSVFIPKGQDTQEVNEEDTKAINAVVTDYAMGFYEIDGKKVQNTCHTDLSKRTIEHSRDGSFDFLSRITHEEINLLGETFNTHFNFNPSTARKAVDIYYADEHHAAAKLMGASWFDYLHLMKVNGEWMIVNIFYEGLPQDEWDSGEG